MTYNEFIKTIKKSNYFSKDCIKRITNSQNNKISNYNIIYCIELSLPNSNNFQYIGDFKILETVENSVTFFILNKNIEIDVVTSDDKRYLCSLNAKKYNNIVEHTITYENLTEDIFNEQMKLITENCKVIIERLNKILKMVNDIDQKEINTYKKKIEEYSTKLNQAEIEFKNYKEKICKIISKKINLEKDFENE